MRKGENSEARTSLQINEAARLIHSGFGTEWLPASTGVEAGGAVTAAAATGTLAQRALPVAFTIGGLSTLSLVIVGGLLSGGVIELAPAPTETGPPHPPPPSPPPSPLQPPVPPGQMTIDLGLTCQVYLAGQWLDYNNNHKCEDGGEGSVGA